MSGVLDVFFTHGVVDDTGHWTLDVWCGGCHTIKMFVILICKFLATLVAQHFTPVSKRLDHS